MCENLKEEHGCMALTNFDDNNRGVHLNNTVAFFCPRTCEVEVTALTKCAAQDSKLK